MLIAVNYNTNVVFEVLKVYPTCFDGKVRIDPQETWNRDRVYKKLSKKQHYLYIDWNDYDHLKKQLNQLQSLLP